MVLKHLFQDPWFVEMIGVCLFSGGKELHDSIRLVFPLDQFFDKLVKVA